MLGLAKVAAQCSSDIPAIIQILALPINIRCKQPSRRRSVSRQFQCPETIARPDMSFDTLKSLSEIYSKIALSVKQGVIKYETYKIHRRVEKQVKVLGLMRRIPMTETTLFPGLTPQFNTL